MARSKTSKKTSGKRQPSVKDKRTWAHHNMLWLHTRLAEAQEVSIVGVDPSKRASGAVRLHRYPSKDIERSMLMGAISQDYNSYKDHLRIQEIASDCTIFAFEEVTVSQGARGGSTYNSFIAMRSLAYVFGIYLGLVVGTGPIFVPFVNLQLKKIATGHGHSDKQEVIDSHNANFNLGLLDTQSDLADAFSAALGAHALISITDDFFSTYPKEMDLLNVRLFFKTYIPNEKYTQAAFETIKSFLEKEILIRRNDDEHYKKIAKIIKSAPGDEDSPE